MEFKKFEHWMDFPINHSHEIYMKRALELARIGSGCVSPNPLVGCVIVHEGTIIGEGWHKKYGHAHAEVNAIKSVSEKSLLRESTLYVNLEPCSHTGKTPPLRRPYCPARGKEGCYCKQGCESHGCGKGNK